MLADFHAEYDEVRSRGDTFLDLWLLIQPLAFNFIVYPGLTFNQLRFFRGLNPNLSESEIVREHKESPLLLYDNNSELVAADIRHGELTLTLNLEARSTSGVAALQARRNPIPIDLSEKGGVISEDYFEPVLCKDRKFSPKPGGYYLLSSNEILSIPPHLNAELKSTHHTGIHGLWDFAGFIDNTFKGNLVFELRSDEGLYALLEHGTPVSLLDIFRCRTKPDKRYGSKIQSHYQDQRGPKVSKHHTDFDFRRAAKEYAKLDKLVLVEQKEILLGLRNKETGLEYVALDHSKRIIEKCSKGFFLSRYDCEDDKKVLQLIPYVLIYGRDETVLTYRRASSIKEYGDSRLFGKQSIGLGGHVTKLDGPNYITGALERELSEEVKFLGKHSEPRLVGTLDLCLMLK
ncbi:2'-deoxycytidine 5'-triphosphate deaminase [Candidatus Woesearchaeota archaeon]|nr:2'-deoxycytidine 5'-triphosphate deaminase [Candidatus Woesearchaeota archaeon]